MRKLLVFQHVASEPLGHLDPLLRAAGVRIRYVNFGREPHAQPDVRRYDGLVVLGGPMNVDQADRLPHLRYEMEAIRTAVTGERPVLGICLGAQLLAAAMGGVVHPNEVPEIGWYRLHTRPAAHQDRLFRHFERQPQFVFQWHAYTFAPPPGAEPLAWTRNCRNQAYRLGDRSLGPAVPPRGGCRADRALARDLPSGRSEIEQHWDAAAHRTHPRRDPPAPAHGDPLGNRVFGEFIQLFSGRR